MRSIFSGALVVVAACTPRESAEPARDTAAAVGGGTTPAAGQTAAAGGINACVRAIMTEREEASIAKVEYKSERGTPTFEFDVRDGDRLYDIECPDDGSGRITETEDDVGSADAAAFKSKLRVSEDSARATALAAHPGTVKAVDYEIQSAGDGDAAYEFDITTADGREMKVEVSASTGQIIEANEELWQIGPEETPARP
jgi:uncharacterized membrane protein YkoI